MPRQKSWSSKRTFKGNRYTKKSSDNASVSSEKSQDSEAGPNNAPPVIVTSASKKKISDSFEQFDSLNTSSKNLIISFDIISSIISKFCVCKECGSELFLDEDSYNGLACKLLLKCSSDSCKYSFEFWSSNMCTDNNVFEVNCRFFYGLRCIGKGPEAGKLFCGLMNLPQPSTSVNKYTNIVRDAAHEVAEESMKKATEEAIEENNEEEIPSDIPIAFDGSWQKRGFVSKNSVCTVTSVDTGKVIDVEVLTKYCSGCERVKGQADKEIVHEANCSKNYEGTSGGMETIAAVNVCKRSITKRGVRYVKFLGDGDSKAFNAVSESKPYGDIVVNKLECIGHVKKRMGCRLRNLKKKLGGSKLSDGKPIKGAGRLTDVVIDKLQGYYGKAIRENVQSVDDMRKAVWAIYHHSISTDEEPKHFLCPPPPETWCKFRKAEAENKIYKHRPIPKAVMEAIRPIFKDLSHPTLLRRCLHGKTQNVNESFNNVVWSRVPKNVFVGRKTLELGVYDSVITFNNGNMGRIEVLKKLGIADIGVNTQEALKNADMARLRKAERAAMEATKEARVRRRRRKLSLEEGDDPDYSSGAF